jgi:hypothetical protein
VCLCVSALLSSSSLGKLNRSHPKTNRPTTRKHQHSSSSDASSSVSISESEEPEEEELKVDVNHSGEEQAVVDEVTRRQDESIKTVDMNWLKAELKERVGEEVMGRVGGDFVKA